MVDIELYSHPKNYETFQSKRPGYINAIKSSLNLAIKSLKGKKDLVLADFCSGTGQNTLKFSKLNSSLKKVILIDINKEFLEIAKNSNIKSKDVILINRDVLKAENFLIKMKIIISELNNEKIDSLRQSFSELLG